MKKYFFIILILLFSQAAFAIEELPEVILPDFKDPEEVLIEPDSKATKFELGAQKVFSQKEIKFGENRLRYGLNFKGPVSLDVEENGTHTTFPFLIEPYIHPIFGKDNKNEARIAFSPFRDTSSFDSQFFAKVTDFYYIRKFNDNHQVLIGHSRVPIGFEGGQSAYTLPFASRSMLATNFGNARALGVRFRGGLGSVEYDIGGYSSTRYLQQVDKGLELVGFLAYKPFKKWDESILRDLKIGGGINYGRADGQYSVISTGFNWDYDRWHLGGEYGYANGYNGSLGFNKNKAQGFNVTLGYFLTEKLQALLRYDYFDRNLSAGDCKIQQYSAGANYYIFKDRAKVQANYTFELNEKQGNKNIVIMMLQLMI